MVAEFREGKVFKFVEERELSLQEMRTREKNSRRERLEQEGFAGWLGM